MNPMSQLEPIATENLIFRGTAAHKGRHISVSPANSSMRHLTYGRILLDGETPKSQFETGAREIALICLSGACQVRIDGQELHDLGQYDAIYIPRNRAVEVTTGGSV